MLSPTTSVAFAATLAGIVLFTMLGHKPLADWDEGIYAEVSRETMRFGWLVPHWNLQPWFEKPPLMLWITALWFKLFGVTEFWARFGSALSGVALVSVVHAWLFRVFGALEAWLSTLILLSTFGFLHAARVGEMDVLLSLACLTSLVGITSLLESKPFGWYLVWGSFGAALMTKGAAAVILPLSVTAMLVRDARVLLRYPREFLLGLAGFLLIVLPWHLALFHTYGRSFLTEYLGFHVLTRATEQIEGHTTRWWYYGKVLLVSAPPSCLLYPAAIRNGLRHNLLRPFALFAMVVVLFFTIVQTRLPQYVVPAYAPLALLTAVSLATLIRRARQTTKPAAFWIGGAVIAALVSLGSIVLTAAGRRSLHAATLADGTIPASNKQAVLLLTRNAQALRDIPGPLLVWRSGNAPIITDVFYSHRQVRQVELHPNPDRHRDRYIYNPVPLNTAITAQPTLILLDTGMLPALPADDTFTRLDRAGNVELGWVVHHQEGLAQ